MSVRPGKSRPSTSPHPAHPRTEHQQRDDKRLLPFGPVFDKMEEAGDAVTQAHNLADYQAVGVRCRKTLLELIGVAQAAAVWTETTPQRSNFREWSELICNAVVPGNSNREQRGALKGALDSAWTFSNWLTQAKSATWLDADISLTLIQHAIGMATSLILRGLRSVPEACPDCGSPDLRLNRVKTRSRRAFFGNDRDALPVDGPAGPFRYLIPRTGGRS